jgi:DNA (cytosine-5)-methyltransferase 1
MILSSEHKTRLSRVVRTLRNGGYSVCSTTLDASEYGVAQRRKRVFFFVTQDNVHLPDLERQLSLRRQPLVKVADALRGIPSPDVRPDKYHDESSYGTFFNHLAMQHSDKVIQKIAAIPPGKGPMSYRRLDPDEPSNTLFSGNRAPPAHFSEPRSITVREAARLQGFPDSFRVFGTFGNQMRQVTNAVPPPLAKVALEVLLEFSGVPLP